MSSLESEKISSYLDAIANEIAIDKLMYDVMYTDPAGQGFLPRPSKSLRYFSRFPTFVKVFLRKSWAYLLFNMFFNLQYFRYLILFYKTCKLKINANEHRNIAIAFSEKATEIINENNINKVIDSWLIFDWIDSSKISKDIPKIDLITIINPTDLKRAKKLAILAHMKMRRCDNQKQWILQSYTAFKWFLVRIGLEKLNSNFLIAEHFDRWAVLVDTFVGYNKSIGIPSEYSLIQHGIIGNISDNISLDLPYKLIYTNELYVYDAESERAFKNNVLSLENVRHLNQVCFYSNLLELSDLGGDANIKVLIVGNPICEILHKHLISRLKVVDNLHVYYKPHPLTAASRGMRDFDLNIINDKSVYPSVDFVISYPSTLELEYRNLNVKTFTHAIDMKVEEAEAFLSEVLIAINLKLS